MFRPCKWANIRWFTELVGRLYTRRGEYLGDDISSYFIARGVNIGYQCHIYVCTCHLKCMHSPYLALACSGHQLSQYRVTASLLQYTSNPWTKVGYI